MFYTNNLIPSTFQELAKKDDGNAEKSDDENEKEKEKKKNEDEEEEIEGEEYDEEDVEEVSIQIIT